MPVIFWPLMADLRAGGTGKVALTFHRDEDGVTH